MAPLVKRGNVNPSRGYIHPRTERASRPFLFPLFDFPPPPPSLLSCHFPPRLLFFFFSPSTSSFASELRLFSPPLLLLPLFCCAVRRIRGANVFLAYVTRGQGRALASKNRHPPRSSAADTLADNS